VDPTFSFKTGLCSFCRQQIRKVINSFGGTGLFEVPLTVSNWENASFAIQAMVQKARKHLGHETFFIFKYKEDPKGMPIYKQEQHPHIIYSIFQSICDC
jgi:hypothetical protein